MESKKDIRKKVLNARNQISEKEWEENSHKICQKVVSHPFFLQADTVYCYLNYLKEVGTQEIVEISWNLGKNVAVPKVEGEEMHFYYIDSYSDVASGYRNILEPTTNRLADGDFGLVIMPGVAFDRMRNRIGFGKGFYDRYMAKNSHLTSIAIAHEMQLVDNIVNDKFDYCPDILITEENIYV